MNINSFNDISNTVGYSGLTLSLEEIVILRNSLLILQKENHFLNIFLWGKLLGIAKDYYISFGYRNDALHSQTYFYSTDGFVWDLLPKPNIRSRLLTPLCVSRLHGDPTLVVDVYEQYANTKPFGTEVFKDHGRYFKELKEEDRLSSLVEMCNEDALIKPRGALFKRADGVVIENKVYEGLSIQDAREIKSYMHWRRPHQRWNTNLLTRYDYNYALDFLDTIDKDIPKTSWTLHIEHGTIAILRSLYWPGMTFYQKINNSEHGSLYIGYGKRNLDIPHMLHNWG